MTDLNDFFYTDGIHDVLAAYVNQLVAGNLRGELSNVETLTANKTLTDASFPIQSVVASGADRDVILPAVAAGNHGFMVSNRAATLYSINVKNAGGTTICTLRPGATAFFVSDGTNGWYCASGLSTAGGIITGVLNAIQLDVRKLAGQTSDLARFGDGVTDYLAIEPDGTLRANGAATWFDDLRVEPTVRTSGTKSPSYVVYKSGIYAYEMDNAVLASEKEVNFKMQMPHGWKIGSAIGMHVHWIAKATGSANQKIRWGLEYTIANTNGTFGATTTIYADTPVNPPSTTPTIDTHYLTDFADLDMTGKTLSCFVLGRLFRNSSDAADTYGDSAFLIGIDAHVEMDTMGSRTEYVK